MLTVLLPLFIATAATGTPTPPAPERYAILVGAPSGHDDETPLTFTEPDVTQVKDVLVQLAGFPADHIITLQQPTEKALRSQFAQLQTQLQAAGQDGPSRALLFVYYSGHGDAANMHLGEHDVSWASLVALTKTVPARTWLMVLDACRSGGVTHVKGARLDGSFTLPEQPRSLPQGFAILTSASAGETAQESPKYGGSLFTHHFLGGLRGAADRDGDAHVSLGEAFDYAADRTTASSSATLGGVQHATFEYNLRGRADLALTGLQSARNLTALTLPAGTTVWLRHQTEVGPLFTEVTVPAGSHRVLWVPRGAYHATWRSQGELHAAQLAPAPQVDLTTLPNEVAPLDATASVAKGSPEAPSHSATWQLAATGQAGFTSPIDAFTPSYGGGLLLTFQPLSWLYLDGQVDAGHATSNIAAAPGGIFRGGFALGARAGVTFWDTLTLSAGARVGGLALREDLGGVAYQQLQPQLQGVAQIQVQLSQHVYMLGEAQALWLPLKMGQPANTTQHVLPQVLVGLGWRF